MSGHAGDVAVFLDVVGGIDGTRGSGPAFRAAALVLPAVRAGLPGPRGPTAGRGHRRRRLAARYGDLGTYSDYFDVWSEATPSGSINQWLSVHPTAYDAIRSVAPGAEVVGPSIAELLATSPTSSSDPGYDLDPADFLH